MKTSNVNLSVSAFLVGVLSICAQGEIAYAAVPTAPTISSPKNGRFVNNPQQTIAGTCANGNTVRITGQISGAPIVLTCSGGRYSRVVSLTAAQGAKSINVTQVNTDGASPARTVQVTLDTVKPALPTITTPTEGVTVNTPSINIAGGCENGAVINITGNITNRSLTCISGTYSQAIELVNSNGPKTINVTQKDSAGNRSDVQRVRVTLNNSAAPGAVKITAPANNTWVRVRNQTLTGTCAPGATVNIFGDIENAPLAVPCSGGNFSRALTLTTGDARKIVKTTQSNNQGTSTQVNRGINLDTTAPPGPTITSHNNNATVNTVAQTIAGACEANAVVTVSGNLVGSSHTLTCPSQGQYSRAVNLTSGNGNKSISVTQRDRAGNVSASRNITLILGGTTSPFWGPRNSNRILLTGHSLVDNPLIDYVQDVAQKKNDSFNYNQQIVIGSPLRVRTKGMNTNSSAWPGYSSGKNKNTDNLNMISEVLNPQTLGVGEKYDTLVITENHSSLGMIIWENTIGYLRHYQDLMIAGNPGTRTFFYHSWLDVNKANPAAWIGHEKNAAVTWECVASKVNQSLQSLNRTDRIRLLPSGGALVDLVERLVANQIPEITGSLTSRMNVIFSDNVHLTRAGAYYMALVVYASTYGKTPAGIQPPSDSGVSAALAQRLQTIAWNYVNSYYSQASNATARSMASCRDFIANNTCSSYWNLQGQPGEVNSCRSYFGTNSSDNPFRDANMVAYPPAW